MGWLLKRTVQCAKCPWRKDVDPEEIPNGYDANKHAALKNTIAVQGDYVALLNRTPLHIMACHEMHDAHCLGWLMQQIGPGNNLQLRFSVRECDNFGDIKLIGEQHERFEDTLHKHSSK
jgi:hypothetical protein